MRSDRLLWALMSKVQISLVMWEDDGSSDGPFGKGLSCAAPYNERHPCQSAPTAATGYHHLRSTKRQGVVVWKRLSHISERESIPSVKPECAPSSFTVCRDG